MLTGSRGTNLDRLLDILRRLVDPPLPPKAQAKTKVFIGIHGVNLNGAPQKNLRVLELPSLIIGIPEIIVGKPISGLTSRTCE
jgi:hypothetical protein